MASGVLLGLSFPPFPFPFLAWFAFVPLLLGLRSDTSARAAFVNAYAALLATFAIAFHWPLLHELPDTALMSLPPLLVIPMWMALPIGLAHAVNRRHGVGAGLSTWVILTILAEYGLRAGPLAFPWTLMGHTQAVVTPVNALAALGGVPLLSLVVLLANAAIYLTIRRLITRGAISTAPPIMALVAGGIVVVTFVSFGVRVTGEVRAGGDPRVARGGPTQVNSGPTRIAGIQPALSPHEWADLADSRRVTLLLRLSHHAVSSDSAIHLIIWPETAVPPLPATRPYFDRMQSFVDSAGVPILAGAITTGDDGSAYRNSAVLLAPGALPSIYDKINLVPFAERVPFAGISSVFDRFAVPAGGVAGYQPGENRRIFEIPQLRFGVLICFETLFSGAARTYASSGADVLIAITQDGWWGDSFGYRQHLAFNRLRSLETGLPLIQSAVSGISALIHPSGRVDETAGWMEQAVWTVTVPTPAPAPPYLRWGDWVTMIAAIAAGVTAGIYAVRFVHLHWKRKRRHAT